jgi:hypothetical protein
MKSFMRVLCLSAIVVVAIAAAVYSAPMPVTVNGVQGTVEVKAGDAGAWKTVKNGEQAPIGATVRTSANSSCMLNWGGGNAVKVSPLSIVKVAQADKTAGGGEKSQLDLNQGKVFAHAKKLTTTDSSFSVKTPTAVAGVRGTEFYGMVESGGQSSFGVTEGSVAAEAGGVEVMLDPGFSVDIDETGTMSEPAPIPVEIQQEVKENLQEAKEAGVAGEQASTAAPQGEPKQETKAEEPKVEQPAAAPQESAADVAAGAVDQITDTTANADMSDAAKDAGGEAVKTGTVEVIIVIDK